MTVYNRLHNKEKEGRTMKNHRLHDVVLGMLLMALIMGLAIPAFATTVRNLQANYADITLVVDGATVIPKDANGNIVEPFAVDGTTYLPVRAVGEALGKEVTWDGRTNTVYVGEVPKWANTTWTGLRDLGTEVGGLSSAKRLPHIAKAIEETHAELEPGIWLELAARPADARTSDSVWFMGDYNDGKVGYRIEGLEGYVGTAASEGRNGYLILMRGILEDIVSDKNDVDRIMELYVEYDRLNAIFTWDAEKHTQAEQSEARKAFNAMEGVYKLNSVNIKIGTDGYGTLRIMPKS